MNRTFATTALLLVGLHAARTARAAAPGVYTLWPADTFVAKTSDNPNDRFFDQGDVLRPRKNDAQAYDLTAVVRPTLREFPAKRAPNDPAAPVAAVIVCPGGGYAFESEFFEGDRVAERLADSGIAAFVLRYRLPGGHAPAADALPAPQEDVLRAIQTVRARAAEWHIDPQHIGVMGFSAGGHLAATAATMYDQAPLTAAKAGNDAISRMSARPDFVVLGYPVITMDATNTHTGSRRNLIGAAPDAAVQQRFSTELHVTPHTPPLWTICAEDDHTVPPVNSRMIDAAAEKAGIPHALMMIAKGGHGFGLGRPEAESGIWFDACLAWLRERKLVGAKP